MSAVPVLFARKDSIYKTLGCDVWDEERDARNWPGGRSLIAHPPCRAWGRLRTFARPRKDEKDLAIIAVTMVQGYGGVLEHPFASTLWPYMKLPRPGDTDTFGGYTLPILQQWFGHRAEKKTLLYIVGVKPTDLPPMPYCMGEASHVVQSCKRADHRPHITKAEREHTPLALAKWLIAVAERAA